MSRIAGAVLVALLAVLAITTVAYAAPPAPPYTPGRVTVNANLSPAADGNRATTVDCPASKVVTGGGFVSQWGAPVLGSYPLGLNQWVLVVGPDTDGTLEPVQVFAICINP